MTPTDEQKAILKATGRVVRINARAGTGKTTTLSMLAKKHRDKRILYLVFNRKAREEAQKTFPSNANVLTIHALAYRKEGYKWKDTLGYFSPADMLFAFKPGEQVLATLSHDFLIYFLNSPFVRLEEAVRPFRSCLPDTMRDLFQHYEGRIVQAARTIATAWNTGQKTCPHDFYLKLFHKSRKFHQELARYDIVLVDEGQDLSPIMVDALRTCKKRIFLVGDSHQQIYSFRYAIDAMRKLSYDEDFELSMSFRFGATIAKLASVFIQEAKQERQFRIQGNRKKSSKVSFYRQFRSALKKKKIAVLSRSNVALFENAMLLRSQGKSFYFEKDIYPLLFKTFDVYWLAQKRPDKIHDPLIRSFKNLEELEDFAEETDNFQLQGMIQIVERYSGDFPDVIFEISELSKERQTPESQEGIILSTIHSAKGQEYHQVYIDADMAENLDVVVKNELSHVTDEINIAYVGFTRAMQRLYLPHELQTVLTPKWNTLLEGYQPSSKKKGRQQLCPGDRVYTSHGPGTILEISGEYCLIDVASRDVKLREHLSNIRM
jgi:F-box protein 18 (helicase)